MESMALVAAFVQTFLLQLAYTESLPPPQFYLSPNQTVYRAGDKVRLMCSAPQNLHISRIVIFKDQWLLTFQKMTSQWVTLTYLLQLFPQESGKYSCLYQAGVSGKEITSSESSSIRISVLDPGKTSGVPRLPAPRLSLSPSRIAFSQGEQVTLMCNVPEGEGLLWFQFYQMKEDGQLIWYRKMRTHTLAISTRYPDQTTMFACSYWRSTAAAGWIKSEQSEKVPLSITGNPVLSLPPNFLLDLQHLVCATGKQVSMTCSASEGLRREEPKAYKDLQGNIFHDKTKKEMGTYETSNVDKDSTGIYSCVYWTSGMNILSPQKNFICVTAPTLSLDPQHPFFILGEEIILNCSAPEGQEVAGYRFYKEEQGQRSWQLFHEGKRPHETFHVDENVAGRHSCLYWIVSPEEQSILSLSSNTILITVRERPPAPTLSLDPQHPFFILGEEVTLTCSAPKRQEVGRYRFYKKEQGQSHGQLFWEGKGPHETFHVHKNAAGWYSCRYCILFQEGREIESLQSDTLHVAVRGPPPAPMLTVDPPSGVVQEGKTLLLTCSFSGNHTEKSFHVYKDGAEMNSTNQGSLKSYRGAGHASSDVSLTISLQAQPKHTGEFACRYEERMNNRWIMSLWSQKVNIIVSSSIQNSSTAWLALLLVIPVVIAFTFCLRRKNHASKSQQESEPGEKQENREELQMLESKAPTDGDLQGSEVAYAHLTFPSAPTYSGPVLENGVSLVKEERVTYSEILFQPTNRAAK